MNRSIPSCGSSDSAVMNAGIWALLNYERATRLSRQREYSAYLKSPHWRTRRLTRMVMADGQCEFQPYDERTQRWGERCSASKNLEVHHLHYRTLGEEADDDLEVLCRIHHLMREAQKFECRWCGERIYSEEEALTLVEGAVSFHGPGQTLSIDSLDTRSRCEACERFS
jgi:hypothetical protein